MRRTLFWPFWILSSGFIRSDAFRVKSLFSLLSVTLPCTYTVQCSCFFFLPILLSKSDTVTFWNFVLVYLLCRALHKKTSLYLKNISFIWCHWETSHCQAPQTSLMDNFLSVQMKCIIELSGPWLQLRYFMTMQLEEASGLLGCWCNVSEKIFWPVMTDTRV